MRINELKIQKKKDNRGIKAIKIFQTQKNKLSIYQTKLYIVKNIIKKIIRNNNYTQIKKQNNQHSYSLFTKN